MTERNPEISKIEATVRAKHMANVDAVRKVQEICPHDKVVESRSNNPRRICVCCGIEEAIRYFTWPSETIDGGYYEFVRPAGLRTILNTEYVKQGDVTQYRVSL